MTRQRSRMNDPEWVPDKDEDDADERRPKRNKPSRASAGPSGDLTPNPSASNNASPPVKGDVQGIANPPLKIASFNIQVFGVKKMDKEKVASTIVKILQRYDVIVVLEIRDSTQTALDELVQECNKVSPDNPFSSVVSARLGRTNSKEQYGFLYRTKKLEVKATYQFDDGVDDGTDMFQREPFAVRFYSPSTELEDFAIIATHTDPDEAAREVGALHKVYESVCRHWRMEDILIAGDYNADEGYVNHKDWKKIVLRHDKRFTWLICDSTDTTTGNTDRAYDRFVVAGQRLTKSVVPGRTKVFEFDKVYGLTYEETRKVSDHYPIEMELCGKVNRELQQQLATSLSVTVKQKVPVQREHDIRKIYRADVGPASAHFTSYVNYDNSRMSEVVARREDVSDVISVLQEFQAAFPSVLQDETIEMVRAYLQGSHIFSPPSDPKHPFVYGLSHNVTWNDAGRAEAPAGDAADEMGKKPGCLDVTVTARLEEPLTVSVTMSMAMS